MEKLRGGTVHTVQVKILDAWNFVVSSQQIWEFIEFIEPTQDTEPSLPLS